MPGKLKKSKCPVTRITIIYLPHFPLSLKKILRVPKLPKWMNEWINNRWKSMLQFVRCWSKKLSWLSQSVLPRAAQCWPHIPAAQKKRYPPSENSFCHCSPFRFGFVVPRWENHPTAPQLIPCQAHHNLQGSSKIKWDLLSFFFFFPPWLEVFCISLVLDKKKKKKIFSSICVKLFFTPCLLPHFLSFLLKTAWLRVWNTVWGVHTLISLK